MVLVHAADVFREKSSSRPGEWTVEVVTVYDDFLALEPAWNMLVQRAGIDHPFLTHEWVRTWWDAFGAGKRLHIVLVKAREELVAIAPLMLTEGRQYGMRLRQLEFIFNVHTPRMDLVVTRARSDVYRALWRYLAERQGLWDVLVLHQLPKGSRTLEELPQAAEADGFPAGVWASDASPYLVLEGTTAPEYMKSLGAKHRSNMRNRTKRLNALGAVRLETIDTTHGLPEALEDGYRIEAAAWKGEAQTAIQCDPALTRFYSQMAHVAAQKGWLRLHFLSVNGRRIAFAYSVVYGRKFYLLKAGYDPEFSPYSPFNLLCERTIEAGFDEGLLEFDFLGSDAEWKLRWTTTTRRHVWLFVFGKSTRARLLHWLKFRVAPVVREQALLRPIADWVRRPRFVPAAAAIVRDPA
jgi:CelD/BcsL family acetyltransferase involved in cellulose biosynthesis